MNSRLVSYFHLGLAAHGFLTVKFNFPYSEGRWRLARKPDRTKVLIDCTSELSRRLRRVNGDSRISSLAAFPWVQQLRRMSLLTDPELWDSKESSSSVTRPSAWQRGHSWRQASAQNTAADDLCRWDKRHLCSTPGCEISCRPTRPKGES
jgi:hypothetical protein